MAINGDRILGKMDLYSEPVHIFLGPSTFLRGYMTFFLYSNINRFFLSTLFLKNEDSILRIRNMSGFLSKLFSLTSPNATEINWKISTSSHIHI